MLYSYSLGSCLTAAVAMCTGTSVVMNSGGSDMKVSTNLPFWLPCGHVKKDAAQTKSNFVTKGSAI